MSASIVKPEHYLNQTGISRDKLRAATVIGYLPEYQFSDSVRPAFKIARLNEGVKGQHEGNKIDFVPAENFIETFNIKPAIPAKIKV